ncbi:hypothetical protein NL676_028391 [Syzygium grande]|nr:hypothetical protein NL676_028391 [Syzygium grande]
MLGLSVGTEREAKAARYEGRSRNFARCGHDRWRGAWRRAGAARRGGRHASVGPRNQRAPTERESEEERVAVTLRSRSLVKTVGFVELVPGGPLPDRSDLIRRICPGPARYASILKREAVICDACSPSRRV